MQHILTNNENEIVLHLALGRITFLKFQEKIILANKVDSLRSIVLLSIEDISKIIGRRISSRVHWDSEENLRMAERAYHYCKALDISVVLYKDNEYPALLRQIADPPYLLFCRGNVKALEALSGSGSFVNAVSVVGTRRLTPAGKIAAKKFAYDAAVNGCYTVSGLATGADGFAHQGAVDAYFDALEKGKETECLGKTIAVLPSAIDEIVPYSNRNLAGKIIQTGGCLISEYEPGMPLANWHFVGRNRIIAGLTPATVVIQAPTGSGALITADFALESGRDVMFHKACFEEDAVRVAATAKRKLEIDFAAGRVSKYKLENSAEKYIEAGAPVVKDYEDYCECLTEEPGKRSQENLENNLEKNIERKERAYIQGELFQ